MIHQNLFIHDSKYVRPTYPAIPIFKNAKQEENIHVHMDINKTSTNHLTLLLKNMMITSMYYL